METYSHRYYTLCLQNLQCYSDNNPRVQGYMISLGSLLKEYLSETENSESEERKEKTAHLEKLYLSKKFYLRKNIAKT